jgi:hypothetical protein
MTKVILRHAGRLACGLLLGLALWFVLIGAFVEGFRRAMGHVGHACHLSKHFVHNTEEAAAMTFFILAVPMIAVGLIDSWRYKGDILNLVDDPLEMRLCFVACYLSFIAFVVTFFPLIALWVGCGALGTMTSQPVAHRGQHRQAAGAAQAAFVGKA